MKSVFLEGKWPSLAQKVESKDTKFGNIANTLREKKTVSDPPKSFPIAKNDLSDNCSCMVLVRSSSSPAVLILCTQNIKYPEYYLT